MCTLKILKSIHVITKMSVRLFDRDFNQVCAYTSDTAKLLSYNFRNFQPEDSCEPGSVRIVTGTFDEVFVMFAIPEHYVLVGPFRCNVIDQAAIERKLSAQKVPQPEWGLVMDHLAALPLYALGDVRDIIIHVNFCFTGHYTDPLNRGLHAYVHTFYVEAERERVAKYRDKQCSYDPTAYQYCYESEILAYVKAGDVGALREMVHTLSNAIVPATSGDMLRSEKNYSIVAFQKLCHVSIDAGCDIVAACTARDSFIRRSEEVATLPEVLKIRDAAIVYFTAEVSKAGSRGYSQLVASIIQFVGLNLNRALRVSQIADAFHFSASVLQKTFKAETGCTIPQYITNRKVEEAKVMLKSGLSVTEIANGLGFFDSSHFSRTFKKATGIAPKQFQKTELTYRH